MRLAHHNKREGARVVCATAYNHRDECGHGKTYALNLVEKVVVSGLWSLLSPARRHRQPILRLLSLRCRSWREKLPANGQR
jgi:hypothetical protein